MQRERAQGAVLAGEQSGLELFLPICSLRARTAVAAQQQREEGGEQEGWEPEQSQPLQHGQQERPRGIRGAEGCTTDLFPIIAKGRCKGKKNLAGRSCTSFGQGAPQSLCWDFPKHLNKSSDFPTSWILPPNQLAFFLSFGPGMFEER